MAYFLFTKAIIEKKPIKVFNNGLMKRDFTYIDDVVHAISSLVKMPPKKNERWVSSPAQIDSSSAPYAIYNIGNNKPIKLIKFIDTIERSIGIEAIKEYLPMQAGDVEETFADIEPLKKKIGFNPTTTIEDGIQNFVEWYKYYYSK
jgi:UDP-glucuronate 4-epimerase